MSRRLRAGSSARPSAAPIPAAAAHDRDAEGRRPRRSPFTALAAVSRPGSVRQESAIKGAIDAGPKSQSTKTVSAASSSAASASADKPQSGSAAPAVNGHKGPNRSTELIYCWDPGGPLDPRGFARADHCDHIHWGMDA